MKALQQRIIVYCQRLWRGRRMHDQRSVRAISGLIAPWRDARSIGEIIDVIDDAEAEFRAWAASGVPSGDTWGGVSEAAGEGAGDPGSPAAVPRQDDIRVFFERLREEVRDPTPVAQIKPHVLSRGVSQRR